MQDDDLDALAAEYVLGTLSSDERAHAEAMLLIDSGFADIVRQWERRLGELNVMVEAVEPPPELWDKIKTAIHKTSQKDEAPLVPAQMMPETGEPETKTPGDKAPDVDATTAALAALAAELKSPEDETGSPSAAPSSPKIERSADVIYLARRMRSWRAMTLLTGALAAVLALFIVVTQFGQNLIPAGRFPFLQQLIARLPANQGPGSRLVAVLQQDPSAPAFLLTVDVLGRTMTVRRVTAAADASHSYELWLIPAQTPTPRALGVVGDQEFTQQPIPASFDVDTVRKANYAISFEPAGGSTTGAPTGPILFTGRLVEALPAAMPKT
jgi:anti-sigma-K factor RskA